MSPGLIGMLAAFRVHRALPRQHVDAFFEAAVQMRPARLVARLRHRDLGDAEADARADLARDRLERDAPGQAETLRLGLFEQPRHHTACRRCLISAVPPCTASSWRKISRRLLGDGVGDVGEHARAFFRGRVLRAAEPAGRRDRADVGQHRLIAARAPQLVHLVAVACGRTNSRCGRDARGRAGRRARPAPRSRRRG